MDMESENCTPNIQENNNPDRPSKERLLDILDQLEAEVERLRKDTLALEEKKDALFTSLDTIRNSELLHDLVETDKDDIQRYIERVTSRCTTVEILVRTDRDQAQVESLYQVNRLIDQLVVSYKADPPTSKARCLSFLAACSPQPEVPTDKAFEVALLGCALDDQKKIKKRLNGLFHYLDTEKVVSMPGSQ